MHVLGTAWVETDLEVNLAPFACTPTQPVKMVGEVLLEVQVLCSNSTLALYIHGAFSALLEIDGGLRNSRRSSG